MDIVIASDENYTPHMAALMCSVCENNKNEQIIFHVFDGGITDETFAKIERIIFERGGV